MCVQFRFEVLIPFSSGLRFGRRDADHVGNVDGVLIPFSSGLRFGLSRSRISRPRTVLIPFSSGLRFGRPGSVEPSSPDGLNPLQFGSSIRSGFQGWGCQRELVLIPFSSGLRFGQAQPPEVVGALLS